MGREESGSRSFVEAIALRQGGFRDSSATISAAARSPLDEPWKHRGHLLRLGHEVENLYPPLRGPHGAIDFFTARRIKWWRSTNTGDPKGGTGPTRNLTSSQLLCVNFLMPLAEHPDLLLRLLQSLDSDVVAVAPIRYTGPQGGELESLVDFEFVGVSGSLEGGRMTRGAHVTSCDALALGGTRGGLLRAYLMEWKYGEQYVGAKNKAAGDSGSRRIARYAERYGAVDGPFAGAAALKDVLYDPIYQIVRLGLLGDKLSRERALGIDEARVVVVCPRDNTSYRATVTAPAVKELLPASATLEDGVRRLWRDPAGVRLSSPEQLLMAVRAGLPPELSSWDAYITERYGW